MAISGRLSFLVGMVIGGMITWMIATSTQLHTPPSYYNSHNNVISRPAALDALLNSTRETLTNNNNNNNFNKNDDSLEGENYNCDSVCEQLVDAANAECAEKIAECDNNANNNDDNKCPSKRESLGVFFDKYKSDKGTERHRYHIFYDRLFPELADKPVQLLEIGASTGSSIDAWTSYFTHPGANISGISYGDNVKGVEYNTDPRVHIYRGSQYDCDFLTEVMKSITPLDILIDDGSHIPAHMFRSMYKLFPIVKPGGLYIIEDIETNYWNIPGTVYGYDIPAMGPGKPVSFIEQMKLMVDIVNQRNMYNVGSGDPHLYVFDEKIDNEIESIAFGRNIVIIRKKVAQVPNEPYMGGRADGGGWSEFVNSQRVQDTIKAGLEHKCP